MQRIQEAIRLTHEQIVRLKIPMRFLPQFLSGFVGRQPAMTVHLEAGHAMLADHRDGRFVRRLVLVQNDQQSSLLSLHELLWSPQSPT